jgi:hypothetical protein
MTRKKEEAGLKFYEYSQNNTGGSFATDDNLCHRLFIEANSSDEADSIAEGLGCYWNGVDEGSDCPCCGDRWYGAHSAINLESMTKEKDGSYPVEEWVHRESSPEEALDLLKARYSAFEWVKEPSLGEKYGSPIIEGLVKINSIEDYAQIVADQYGWTSPDARIFYHDGRVKEIFSAKIEEQKAKKKSKVNKIG